MIKKQTEENLGVIWTAVSIHACRVKVSKSFKFSATKFIKHQRQQNIKHKTAITLKKIDSVSPLYIWKTNQTSSF